MVGLARGKKGAECYYDAEQAPELGEITVRNPSQMLQSQKKKERKRNIHSWGKTMEEMGSDFTYFLATTTIKKNL